MSRDPADQSQLLWCPAVSATATSIWQQLCERVWARPNHLGPSQIPDSQRQRDNKMGTVVFATNSRKHNIWCSGNHLKKKKSSSYYHLWNNQPFPCSFNNDALLRFFCFLIYFWTLPSFISLGLPQHRCRSLSPHNADVDPYPQCRYVDPYPYPFSASF